MKEGKQQQLAHHGLIKLIVKDALNRLRVLVLWSTFKDMDREAFLDTQVLRLGEILASSAKGEEAEAEEEGEEEEEEK